MPETPEPDAERLLRVLTIQAAQRTPKRREVEGNRLLLEYLAGEREPEPVTLPPLPSGAPLTVRLVAEFFRLMRGLRLSEVDDWPVPFGCAWVAGWLGVSDMAVSRARDRLLKADVLVDAGAMPGRFGRAGADKFLPGDVEAPTVVIRSARREKPPTRQKPPRRIGAWDPVTEINNRGGQE